ncbi:hypothetical protein C8J56DRAFT_1042000 [Mycena floridula]|nr:hypothetical protein C8J56DRAFT_1042000 [Mycena floridula]
MKLVKKHAWDLRMPAELVHEVSSCLKIEGRVADVGTLAALNRFNHASLATVQLLRILVTVDKLADSAAVAAIMSDKADAARSSVKVITIKGIDIDQSVVDFLVPFPSIQHIFFIQCHFNESPTLVVSDLKGLISLTWAYCSGPLNDSVRAFTSRSPALRSAQFITYGSKRVPVTAFVTNRLASHDRYLAVAANRNQARLAVLVLQGLPERALAIAQAVDVSLLSCMQGLVITDIPSSAELHNITSELFKICSAVEELHFRIPGIQCLKELGNLRIIRIFTHRYCLDSVVPTLETLAGTTPLQFVTIIIDTKGRGRTRENGDWYDKVCLGLLRIYDNLIRFNTFKLLDVVVSLSPGENVKASLGYLRKSFVEQRNESKISLNVGYARYL